MTERVATTTGLLPLPDPAKEELSDLKGHQKHDLISGTEREEIASAYAEYRREVIDDQQSAGLDRITEGQLRWDDMLAHPLTTHDNVDPNGIVRYYDNNNFYRDPQVRGDLDFSGDVAEELDAAADLVDDPADSLQAVLPGPYSLFDLASDEHYGDDAEFFGAIADFLAGEVEAFPDHKTLTLHEPSLVENPPNEDLVERLAEAVDTVAGETDADVVVHTYFGALDETTYAHLMDADVEALGFDLVAGDREDTLSNITEFGTKDAAALGIADGQNTLVESADTLNERVEWFEDQIPVQEFDRLYLSTNTEPFYLPVNKHLAKLEAIAAAAGNVDAEEVTA
ncbi:5-methyltetrahydropteroyltriglutamate--homocysteine methyltransferase [Halonotius terrestris]|uniref:5-methyltetrahydropteroyltriglutamate--homocysteine methyltransferase n=1 Tax=Halonotius terrestris TaxID=2487750 RepID=A0A8J8P9C8_9EURY|nr:5-methyltetrahydropteroyltriglutamate--homocysteine methyltransferase [Halonotius terrestris]TQQ82604.1 5-methyltetrahydropteroyltriglutamate--homocysteine methyltransferase [Halonotius terrestris]